MYSAPKTTLSNVYTLVMHISIIFITNFLSTLVAMPTILALSQATTNEEREKQLNNNVD